MPSQPTKPAKATLTALQPKGTPLTVHFNPASLVYSVENSVAQQSGGPKKVQYVAQFSAKLTMDLQFDTTDTGSDVRTITKRVAHFMQTSGQASANAANAAAQNNGNSAGPPPTAPPVLRFQWGSYFFQGIMDSFKETIDFFSADGVALRSLVSIGLSRQDLVIDDTGNLSGPPSSGSLVPSSSSDSALSLATRGGDPSATRQLGAANSLESLRFTGGTSLQVSGGVQLNPPAAFVAVSASGGAGLSLGVSGGISIGGSAGASAGISAGASAGVSVSASASSDLAPAFGGSASAGVPASAGAFAGLQTGRAQVSSTSNLNPLHMLPATSGANISSFDGASFSLGGAASSSGSAGLSTDVGANFSFNSRLTFSFDD